VLQIDSCPRKGNKRQKTSQTRASEHLEKEVGVNAVLTTAAESVEVCNQVLVAGIVAKSAERKALQEELADVDRRMLRHCNRKYMMRSK
jgi:hypothetical protein